MRLSPFPFAALAAALVAACGDVAPPVLDAKGAAAAADPYVSPPFTEAARLEGGTFIVRGQAAPKARIRFAEPSGAAVFAVANGEGRWVMNLPTAAQPRVFGVSATLAGRTVQAPGYLLLSPDGRAAVLRAGGGAMRLDALPAPAIGAVDFDREGGAVVTGAAPANAAFDLRVDGRQAAEVRADAAGRFEVALPTPLGAGVHRFQVLGAGFEASAVLAADPAQPLAAGPFRGVLAPAGLRADWITPGGGVQSTILPG